MSNISEIFYSNDTIYHFCKSSIAIENILFEKQLRLTARKKSNDPIENLIIGIIDSNASYPENFKKLENNTNEDVEKIRNFINLRLSNLRQLCFCKNKVFRKKNMVEYPKEYFGFLKPRMWDQYGDNYRGVCLAFSKKKLLNEKKIILQRDVKYLNYKNLQFQNNEIDRNELFKTGIEKYTKSFTKDIEKLMFRKHQDYKDENEYRIFTLSQDEYDFINIEKSINGIIVSPNHINKYSLEILKQYSKEMQIDLLYINWKDSGVSINKELHSPYFKTLFKTH